MITYGSITLTSYNSITKTEVYYYKSTSATALSGGSWSTTKPTWENGKYIWQKIKTLYEDGSSTESDAVNITGQQGATGTAATSYKLTCSNSIITKSAKGEYSVNTITFSSYSKTGTGNMVAYAGRFVIETLNDKGQWVKDTAHSSTANESTKTYTVPADIVSIRCSLYQGGGVTYLLDQMTVPIVNDGLDGQPIETKTYTGLIGSANDVANASFYFAKIHPTNFTVQWKVRFKIYITAPEAYSQSIDIQFGGYGSVFNSYDAYVVRNASLGAYFVNLYRAKAAGITNHKGHAVGIGLRASTNPTDATYARDIKVELISTESCTVDFLNTAVKYANMDGTGTTNYDNYTEMTVATAGQNATNNTNYYDRTLYNQAVKAGSAGYTSTHIVCGTSAGYVNIGANVNFDIGYPLLYSTATVTNGNTANSHYLDIPGVNYSINGTIEVGTAYKMLYLKGTLTGSTFTIASSPFMTTVVPNTPDGFYYIPLGEMSSATSGRFVSSDKLYAYLNGAFQAVDTAAQKLAEAAQTKAVEALTSANNKNKIYYSTSAPTGGTYIDGDTWFDTDDDNSVHIYNGSTKKWVKQQLGENAIADASISNAKIANATIQSAKIANLDGAKIVANTITANKLATDAIKSNNYLASSNTSSPYSAAGTFLDLATGNIYTPNFGVDSVNGGAYINGQVVASTGQIGDSAINYWQIGSHIDYNMNPSAAIIGHGTSFIQSGQWQISNNRINTQTYDAQNKITYLHHNSKYWDYGMQVPELDTTKSTYIDGVSNNWLYIRRSTADSIPALENNWEYLFRVDKDGTVYENGVKLSEKYASIDGVSGAYLPRSGGTITGNLTVNGTLTATASKANALSHTLSINGQSWSGSANLTINTLGVAYGGTGKTTGKDAANYFLNSLDTGSSTPVDGDYYISQYVSGGTTTTTYHRRPMSALWLYVKSKLSAADIYVPKTGGIFTGAVTMSDVLNADSITAGDLLVNGAARFNNGLRATNINGGQAIYTVIGTQTATTAAWTGELPINELYDGLTIAYYLPRTSANNVTLKLTLANGEETAAIPVYVTSTTRMTTHYGAGSTILLTYWSEGSVSVNGTAITEDRWTHGDYWNSNTIGEYGGSCIAGEHGMARYSLIIQTDHDVWESLVTTSTTATTKTKNPSGFLITSPILYQNGNTYVEGGIAGYSSCWSVAQGIDTRYSFNVSSSWSSNGHSLYLVGTISGDKFTLKDTTWWADELPETNDGYYYWYIGQMASAYTYTLHPVHPIYYYDNGIKVLNVGALTSSQVTDALGYTPYNATNPNGYTTNKGTVTSVRVQASAPLQSSTNTAQGTTLDTTISFANQNKNLVLASPSSGNAGAPTFRSLVSDDIPSLAWSKITSGNDDLKAIEALTGTSGFLKKTAANTWSLDTNTYLTTHQTVTDKNATLTWGAATTVATIGSTNINVSLPSNPNNHYTANLITGASNSAKANAAATNGNVFLNLIENSTVRNYHNLKGGNGLTVTSDANGVVTFTSPAAFTGVSFGDGKLTFSKSDGNTTEILTDDFVITQATGATGLVNSSGQGLNVGGATTKPVYFKNGVPTEVTSIPYTLLTGAPTSMTPTAHTHGNIQNSGTLQTSDITVGNGDKIVVTDSSSSNKVARSSIAFDGSTKTQALTKAGTWETFNNYSLPLAASGTRGGVKIGYTTSGKNYAVQLSDEKMYVNVPWTDTTYSAGTGLSLSGTTFNHSNSVTAGTVGSTAATSSTDRTITIPYVTYDAQGHITKTGTHTHTITSYPEADLSWGGKNFSGSYGCIDAAMIPELGANRFAFLHAAGIEIEYSRDNGETWVDYEATNEAKTGLFGAGSPFYLGKATTKTDNNVENQLRITITTNLAGIYTTLNKIAIYMSTQGNATYVKIERAPHSAPTDYTTHLDWTQISGWSGWNILNIGNLTTYGNTAAQYQKVRFTFKQTTISTNYPSAIISKIMGFGGVGWTIPSNMAKDGHLYAHDNSQNATFPANVTATTFIGALSGNATSATSADSATKATQDSDGHQINTTYLKLAGGTMTGVLTAKKDQYTDSYSGALNMNNSNIYGVNAIYTADSSDNAQEGIHFYRSATTVDSLHAKAGVLYFTPNRTLGQVGTSYTVYHTGNKPSKSDVGLGNVDNTADANKVVKGVSAAAGTANSYRHVWFSDSATETHRNNDADFTYNPNTNDLKVPSVTGTTMNLSNWKIEQDSSTESLMFRYVG